MDKNAFIQQMRFESSIHLTDINGKAMICPKLCLKASSETRGPARRYRKFYALNMDRFSNKLISLQLQ